MHLMNNSLKWLKLMLYVKYAATRLVLHSTYSTFHIHSCSTCGNTLTNTVLMRNKMLIICYYRLCFTRNIQYKVMCGALDVYCMKYGVWAINHLKIVVE